MRCHERTWVTFAREPAGRIVMQVMEDARRLTAMQIQPVAANRGGVGLKD